MALPVEEELVELRRRDACAGEHGVGLSAVVDLVLEEMGEDGVDPLGDRPAAVGRNPAVEVGAREPVAEGDEPGVGRALRCGEGDGFGVVGRVGEDRPAPAALPGRVEIVEIDGEHMVEGRPQRRKEPGSRRREVLGPERGAGPEEPCVRPGVVAGHRPEMLHEPIHALLPRRAGAGYSGGAAAGKPARRMGWNPPVARPIVAT